MHQEREDDDCAGYVRASPCESNQEGEGAMGAHFMNGELLDGKVSADQPEALLYELQPNDGWGLVGVEYVVPAAAVDEVPSLFGEEFHGPTNVGAPWGLQYDLHVWCWRANLNGIFAPFDPNVSCPDSDHT